MALLLLLLIAVAIVSTALFVIIIMQHRRRQWNEDEGERVTMAAKYNPHRRTTLGKKQWHTNNNNHRGSRRERRRQYQRTQGKAWYSDANNNDANSLRLSVFYKFIISSFQQVLSCFRSCIIPFAQFHLVTLKTDDAVSKSTLFASYSHIGGGANSLDEYYSNAIVIGLDCEMVGAGRGGKDSMLARCSLVTLDFVPNEHGVDGNNDDTKNVVVDEKVSTCTLSVHVDEGGLTTTTTTANDTADNSKDDNSSNKLTMKLEKQTQRKIPTGPIDTNLIILYDKYVIPRRIDRKSVV